MCLPVVVFFTYDLFHVCGFPLVTSTVQTWFSDETLISAISSLPYKNKHFIKTVITIMYIHQTLFVLYSTFHIVLNR